MGFYDLLRCNLRNIALWKSETLFLWLLYKPGFEMECDTVDWTAGGCVSCISPISSDFWKCNGPGNLNCKNTYRFLPVFCIMGIPASGLRAICYRDSEKHRDISREKILELFLQYKVSGSVWPGSCTLCYRADFYSWVCLCTGHLWKNSPKS